MLLRHVLLSCILMTPFAWADNQLSEFKKNTAVSVIDLRNNSWGQGESHPLDGLWDTYWGHFIAPEDIAHTSVKALKFPVPGVWSTEPYRYVEKPKPSTLATDKPDGSPAKQTSLPALGYTTYHAKVLVPKSLNELYLYIPDMPSAYKLWVNGKLSASNGQIGFFQNTEEAAFLPKTVKLPEHDGALEFVIQISNFHYREGGVWFSLRLTDESGRFSMEQQPIILAVFFGAILIAIGLYNFSLFAFRSKEVTSLYFGLLCLVVGGRRLLIDERVIYMFDWFSWATLQRIEHLLFYLTLPLFMGFFAALYKNHIPNWTARVSWILIVPFVLLCLSFTNRIYTELNIAFQVLVIISMTYAIIMYIRMTRIKGLSVKAFGASLLILALAVAHDVLKTNGLVFTPINLAHYGVLAFVISQAIALQRNYLKNLDLVETMSAQLKSRNHELIEMDAFKDEFLATTSHELRTPLQGISGLAKILKEDNLGNFSDDQQHKIDLIANTTQRLSVLVNDILDFSSIKHGKLKLNTTHVDLSAIADLVLSTMRPLVNQHSVTQNGMSQNHSAQTDIKLAAQIDPKVRFLKADEFRLQQILINLMGNAVKYTPHGFIHLTAFPLNNQIIIEISDSGVGIPEEKRQSLFRPFEQVHVEGHHSASGTGLGLSISQQLVELHGGSLEIASQVGKGTTVTMKFPIDMLSEPENLPTINQLSLDKSHTDSRHAIHNTKNDEISADGSAFTQDTASADDSSSNNDIKPHTITNTSNAPVIFIVDDEPMNCELVASQLNGQDYQIELFEDGLKVLSRLNEKVPDLILLDFMMPRMSGLEVCQSIRKYYDSYELPVMMLTARHQISDIVAALTAGANDYLIKPYHDKELLARVSSQLTARKYWIANRENQKLKNEIERREILEEELSELNARLLNVLDISDELIILINDSLHIAYANEKAVNMLQTNNDSILGKPILEKVNDDLGHELQRLIKEQASTAFNMETRDIRHNVRWQASVKSFYEFDKAYLALVITPINDALDPSPKESSSAIASLSHKLNENRKKINEIEGALRQVMTKPVSPEKTQPNHTKSTSEQQTEISEADSVPGNSTFDQAPLVHLTEQDAPKINDQKELIVSLLRTSLSLWERHTNKGKVELAENSRCWRVYVDGTTVKTRTFDKYLSARTVPDRPRWRAVVRTANFVLASCELSENEQQALTQLTQSVEDLYT